MGLADRWYMHERGRLREAWRRHRPPERTVPPFDVVVRRPSTSRRWLTRFGWLIAGAALGGAVVLSLVWQEGLSTELADALRRRITFWLVLVEEVL